MKLRTRDAVAAVLAVVLARVAWTDDAGPESVSVTLTLAFYAAVRSSAADPSSAEAAAAAMAMAAEGRRTRTLETARPVPLDVDGDGVVEAVVVPAVTGNGTGGGSGLPGWGLRVLDLKPMHVRRSADAELAAFPFHPRVMFESRPASDSVGSDVRGFRDGEAVDDFLTAVPIKMTSGQIVLRPQPPGPPPDPNRKDRFVPSSDRTRHFFCGRDWHDAAARCGTHCPSGTSTECPDGETCYADTPCDAKSPPAPVPAPEGWSNRTRLIKTPAGGLPSVVTAWSDGSVTLHSVTGDYDPSDGGKRRKKRRRAGEPDPGLELRLMWRVNPFVDSGEKDKAEKGGGGDEEGGGKGKAEKAGGQEGLRALDPGRHPERRVMSFHELDVRLDADSPVGTHGAVVLVAARHRLRTPHSVRDAASYHAIDAFTGEALWDHRGVAPPFGGVPRSVEARRAAQEEDKRRAEEEEEEEKRAAITDERRMLGHSRRRSHLRDILGAGGGGGDGEMGEADDVAASEDCMARYRRWITDPSSGALPHLHWGGGVADARLSVAHFDRRREHRGGTRRDGRSSGGRGRRSAGSVAGAGKRRSWQKKMLAPPRRGGDAPGGPPWDSRGHGKRRGRSKRGPGPTYARPNVVIFHNRDGLHVLSLKNGRPVCHISLLDDSLYDDLNGDGVVDQVQVITRPRGNFGMGPAGIAGFPAALGDGGEEESGKFASGLIQRVMREAVDRAEGGDGGGVGVGVGGGERARRYPPGRGVGSLCHALVLSGLPPREEVFSASLCPDGRGGFQASAAPPLVVEGLDGGPSKDVVFAMGTGSVSRYDPHGSLLWTAAGTMAGGSPNGVPTWDAPRPTVPGTPQRGGPAHLGRIDFAAARGAGSPLVRPIVVSGEDGVSVLSAGRGRVLATATFPQSSVARPVLADVSGDGTTDVMVVSADGLWGYKVTVRTGGSRFLRIAVGLLLVGIGAAALWNKFSQPPGVDRRSTDA